MTQDSASAGPTILQRPHFDVAIRGYEKAQVDERDAALQQLQAAQQELESLRSNTSGEQAVELAPPKDEISLFGDRLQTILTTAEQEANAATAEARDAADRTRADDGNLGVEAWLGVGSRHQPVSASHTSRSRSTVQMRGWSIPSSSSHARWTLNGMVCSKIGKLPYRGSSAARVDR